MKAADIHKKLALEFAIIAVVAGVLGATAYGLMLMIEDYTKEARDIEAQVTKFSTESTALRTKYDNTRQQMDIYEEALKKNPKTGLYSNRQEAQDVFNNLQKMYGVNVSRVNLSAPRELTEARYKRDSASVSSTEVKLAFDVASDEQFYAMLDAIQKDLLGVTEITAIKLVRAEPISDAVVKAVEKNGSYPLIKGEMTANWFLLQSIEKEKPADAPSP